MKYTFDPVARTVLGGVLGWIAKSTIPLPSMVSADQGCAAARGPRATVRLCGPTWEDPASIRNTPGSQSCRSKPTSIAATSSERARRYGSTLPILARVRS
jgi:hypothetical protein